MDASRGSEGAMDVMSMVESAPHPVFVADEEDRILALSAAAEELLGGSGDEVLGRAFHEVLEPRDVFGNRLSADGGPLHAMVRRGEPVQAFDLDVRQLSGRYQRAGLSIVVVLGPEADRYRLVYHVIPRRRRRLTDEAIDLLLKNHGTGVTPRRREDGEETPRLTRREREVLTRLVAGESTSEISAALDIRPNTLRSHTQHILRKLGARNRVEAVSLALRKRLV